MKKSILSIACFLLSVLIFADANADVCFIVGGCSKIKDHLQDCQKMGYKTCNGEGLVGDGDLCIVLGHVYYEYCDCDKSIYKYSEKDLGDKYEGVDAMQCHDGMRYKNRTCKSQFKYAESIPLYNPAMHTPVMLCSLAYKNSVVDKGSEYCIEKFGIKEGFYRYSACTCPTNYSLCRHTGFQGATDAQTCQSQNLTYYSSCGCAEGYAHDCAGEAYTYEGQTCYKCDVGTPKKDIDPSKARYTIHMLSNGTYQQKAQNLVSAWMQKGSTECYKQPIETKVVIDENGEEKTVEIRCNYGKNNASFVTYGNKDIADDKLAAVARNGYIVKTIKIHPLVSYSGYASSGASIWRIELGIQSDEPIDFPFFMIGDLNTGYAYKSMCPVSIRDRASALPTSYEYTGWLSGLPEWVKSRGTQKSGAYAYSPQQYDNKFSVAADGGIGCNPAEFEPYKQANGFIDLHTYVNAEGKSEVFGYGGDKCVNYVLSRNLNNMYLPLAVADEDKQILYLIDNEYRAQVSNGYENSWSDSGDWTGNFLLWKVDLDDQNQICYYRKEEFDNNLYQQVYLETYPDFNTKWMTKNMDISYEEFKNNPRNNTYNTIYKTNIGGDYGKCTSLNNEEYSTCIVEYYQRNFDNVMNGKNSWSYPWSY